MPDTRLVCRLLAAHQGHEGDRVLVLVGNAEQAVSDSALVEEFLDASAADEIGLPQCILAHFHVMPADPHPQPGAQGFEQRFLGRETLGDESGFVAVGRIQDELMLAEDALGETPPVTPDSGVDA